MKLKSSKEEQEIYCVWTMWWNAEILRRTFIFHIDKNVSHIYTFSGKISFYSKHLLCGSAKVDKIHNFENPQKLWSKSLNSFQSVSITGLGVETVNCSTPRILRAVIPLCFAKRTDWMWRKVTANKYLCLPRPFH